MRSLGKRSQDWCPLKDCLKGTVHPKMKILSFTHPQVDPNLYECVCSEHKGRYSEEWGKQSSIFLLLLKSMVPQNSLITNLLKISSFVFRTNTFIQVWIYLRMSKWWQNYHFWVYCLFKVSSAQFGISTIGGLYVMPALAGAGDPQQDTC